MKRMVNFRNILVHEYLDIDHEFDHCNVTENLDDFDRFAKAIIDYLEEHHGEPQNDST